MFELFFKTVNQFYLTNEFFRKIFGFWVLHIKRSRKFKIMTVMFVLCTHEDGKRNTVEKLSLSKPETVEAAKVKKFSGKRKSKYLNYNVWLRWKLEDIWWIGKELKKCVTEWIFLSGLRKHVDIVSLLIYFCMHPLTIVVDISRIFHQINFDRKYRDLCRFFWHNDATKESKVKRFKRSKYGLFFSRL